MLQVQTASRAVGLKLRPTAGTIPGTSHELQKAHMIDEGVVGVDGPSARLTLFNRAVYQEPPELVHSQGGGGGGDGM